MGIVCTSLTDLPKYGSAMHSTPAPPGTTGLNLLNCKFFWYNKELPATTVGDPCFLKSFNLQYSLNGLGFIFFTFIYIDRIGWRKSSRKIILLATDGDYHNALDGKLGTIHKRHRHFFPIF